MHANPRVGARARFAVRDVGAPPTRRPPTANAARVDRRVRFRTRVLAEVHVEVEAAAVALAPLARHLRLDPAADAAAVLEQLAKLRVQACVDALVARGVGASRLRASSRVCTGAAAAASFGAAIPPAADPAAFEALPLVQLVPRVLSRRHDPRGCLGLDAAASAGAVRKRYLHLALRLHPDKAKHPQAPEAFTAIEAAWQKLRPAA